MLQGLKDKQLAKSTCDSELEQRDEDARVCADELDSVSELCVTRVCRMDDGDVREGENRESCRDEGGEEVDEKHHLLAGRFVQREYLILSRVYQAI